jgi:hypothetical protein
MSLGDPRQHLVGGEGVGRTVVQGEAHAFEVDVGFDLDDPGRGVNGGRAAGAPRLEAPGLCHRQLQPRVVEHHVVLLQCGRRQVGIDVHRLEQPAWLQEDPGRHALQLQRHAPDAETRWGRHLQLAGPDVRLILPGREIDPQVVRQVLAQEQLRIAGVDPEPRRPPAPVRSLDLRVDQHPVVIEHERNRDRSCGLSVRARGRQHKAASNRGTQTPPTDPHLSLPDSGRHPFCTIRLTSCHVACRRSTPSRWGTVVFPPPPRLHCP